MSDVVQFPIHTCSGCGAPTNQKIDLVDLDSGMDAGVKYLCANCQPLDEDGLRLLVDRRDEQIASLQKLLDETVRDRENYNGYHQVAVMEIDRLRFALEECCNLAGAYTSEKDAIDWLDTIGAVALKALSLPQAQRNDAT